MTSIKVLNLSHFVERRLRMKRVDTIESLVRMDETELSLIPGFGPLTIQELKQKLALYLAENPLDDLCTFISSLGLSKRTYNALRRGGVDTIEHLVTMRDEELLSIRNFGETALAEIREKLAVYLAMHPHLNQDRIENDSIPPRKEELPQQSVILSVEKILATLPAQQPIERLELPVRPYNALKRSKIHTIERLVLMSEVELLGVRNLGEKSLRNIQCRLKSYLQRHPLPEEFTQLVNNYKLSGTIQLSLTSSNNCNAPPKQTKFLIEPDLHEHASHLPLDKISINRLVLSKRLHNKLLLHQIESVGALIRQTADTFVQPEPLSERLSWYIEWLLTQDAMVWEDEIEGRGLSPIYKNVLEETSLDTFIANWFADLSERERQILLSRYGLRADELTLDQLGKRFSVTRERVRQIQKQAENKLKKEPNLRKIEPLIAFLHHQLTEADGLISTQQLDKTIRETLSIEHLKPIPVASLIFSLDDTVKRLPGDNAWGDTTLPLKSIVSVQLQFITLLEQEQVPMSPKALVAELKQSEFYQNCPDELDDALLFTCLRIQPKIQIKQGMCSLKKRGWQRLAGIILALRQIGEPVHYKVISERANALLPPSLHETPHNVHAELGRRPDIFVRVGRGIFGLAEWGLTDDGCVANAAYRVLIEAGKPLHYDIITDRVLETWKVNPGSVYAALSIDDRFVNIGSGVYWVRDQEMLESNMDFGDLFGAKLAQRQKEIEHWNNRVRYDTHNEVDLLRGIGTDFFKE